MITEAEVIEVWEAWCRKQGGAIVQIVYPGGQAALSITYRNLTGRKKTVFPDIIAVVDGRMMVGEAKPTFSIADAAKLSELAQSLTAVETIRNILGRRGIATPKLEPLFFLAHGSAKAQPVSALFQFIVVNHKCVLRCPSDFDGLLDGVFADIAI